MVFSMPLVGAEVGSLASLRRFATNTACATSAPSPVSDKLVISPNPPARSTRQRVSSSSGL